mgnify:CR=1 FL=1
MPKHSAVLEVPEDIVAFDKKAINKFLTDAVHAAAEESTRSAYMCTYKSYRDFCTKMGYTGKATTESIGIFLMAKCKAVGNAASFAQWKSHVTRTAHKLGDLDPEGIDTKLLSELEWACGKMYGHASTQ